MTSTEELAPQHSGALNQPTLFRSTQEELVAETFVSADELGSWHAKGWLSFNLRGLPECDAKERIEVLFIKALARSGLSDAMINRTLSGLEKPYCYDPSTTFFSFLENRWITLPPEPDPADVASEYLEGLVKDQDWGGLRKLRNKILQALEHTEDTDE